MMLTRNSIGTILEMVDEYAFDSVVETLHPTIFSVIRKVSYKNRVRFLVHYTLLVMFITGVKYIPWYAFLSVYGDFGENDMGSGMAKLESIFCQTRVSMPATHVVAALLLSAAIGIWSGVLAADSTNNFAILNAFLGN